MVHVAQTGVVYMSLKNSRNQRIREVISRALERNTTVSYVRGVFPDYVIENAMNERAIVITKRSWGKRYNMNLGSEILTKQQIGFIMAKVEKWI